MIGKYDRYMTDRPERYVDAAVAVEDIGDGWKPLVQRCIDALEAEGRPYVIDQVKEKFGTLRFYWHFAERTEGEDPDRRAVWERLCAVVRDAERESARTCEACGKPGTLDTSRSWILTLCEEHKAARAKD